MQINDAVFLSLREILDEAIQQLQFLDSPQLEAELLLSFVLNKPRRFLYTYPEFNITHDQQSDLNNLIQRRLHGEPLAYLIEQKEFWSLPLRVTRDVLIPRAETELLVEKCLELLPHDESLNIADLGTGSGAIALALASECPQWKIFATDQDAAALALARENAGNLKINNIIFLLGNWCAALPKEKFSVIISNPPYIDVNDPELEINVRHFEPQKALLSADNGLADLKTIALQARDYLAENAWLLLEHGYRQADAVASYLRELNYNNIQTFSDLAGLPRVTIGFK